jgi:hypothetical protein
MRGSQQTPATARLASAVRAQVNSEAAMLGRKDKTGLNDQPVEKPGSQESGRPGFNSVRNP